MKTLIYGASDDLVIIEGEISEEIGCYELAKIGLSFTASDGTKGKITYNGEWKIVVKTEGSLIGKLYPSVGEEEEHTGEAKSCSSYSDVLVLEDGIEWIKINKQTLKP